MTTKKTLTSEAQLDSNELLLKLQAVEVFNLYVVGNKNTAGGSLAAPFPQQKR